LWVEINRSFSVAAVERGRWCTRRILRDVRRDLVRETREIDTTHNVALTQAAERADACFERARLSRFVKKTETEKQKGIVQRMNTLRIYQNASPRKRKRSLSPTIVNDIDPITRDPVDDMVFVHTDADACRGTAFDPVPLVEFLNAGGKRSNPLTGAPFTDDDLRSLEYAYMKKTGLEAFIVRADAEAAHKEQPAVTQKRFHQDMIEELIKQGLFLVELDSVEEEIPHLTEIKRRIVVPVEEHVHSLLVLDPLLACKTVQENNTILYRAVDDSPDRYHPRLYRMLCKWIGVVNLAARMSVLSGRVLRECVASLAQGESDTEELQSVLL